MRSPTRPDRLGPAAALALALGALAAATGCGNYSTEDIRFYEALPTRSDLRVVVPVTDELLARLQAGPAAVSRPAAPTCDPGASAEPWLEARRTSDGINASVDWLVGLVDVVRRVPPTTRPENGRIWGPFDDEKHPGVRIAISIKRRVADDGTLDHVYEFQATRSGDPTPHAVLFGTFRGPSATHGDGELTLDFDALRAAGMEDADTPAGRLEVRYDRTVDPRTIALRMAVAGAFGLVQEFTYDYRGYQDGRGLFRYRFQKPAAVGVDTLTVSASFAADGAGRGLIGFRTVGGATGIFDQCWSAQACLTWFDDRSGYSCGFALPCSGGAESACPAVEPPLSVEP